VNAIIMAAGTGTRLRPLTDDRPTGMVEVNGTPIVERQIRHFLDVGVDEVILVTGHRAERFAPLSAKYGRLTFLPNPKYETHNNIYSMYLARDRLGESYVSEADVLMHRNYLLPGPETSLLFGGYRRGFAKEWILRFGPDGRVHRVDVQGGEGVILAGLSFWTAADARVVRERLEALVEGGGFENLFWDDVYMSCLDRVPVYLREIDPGDWSEVDTPEDLKDAEARDRGRV
jgi:CTP:phosphocholine cytidylyltransferase-like protein